MQTAPEPLHFAPIQTRRTFEEICERIRERVAAGDLKPGDKLPAERELAQQLGVGRNALREALRSLEIAGIVELRKGVKGGAFIRAGDPGRMDAVVRDMFSLGSISLSELAEARLHVQDLVVRLACERATEADYRALEAVIDRTEAMTEAGRYL
ncbi:MAG TPA: GntR family transcriptional regulator, partial [Albitalea sp.]